MVGDYQMAPGRTLEIKHANGHWSVILENKELPAAIMNDQLVFTTGDVVVGSSNNAGPRAAKLEMFSIKKTPEGMSFQDDSPTARAAILKKVP